MESKSQFSQIPPRTDRFEDEESSSLSDCDSEWTQVSGTEDDSDYLPLTAASNRSLSRADTMDSSNDGDMWEGFIDGLHRSSSQSSDQARPLDLDATDKALPDSDNPGPGTSSQEFVDGSTNDAPDSSLTWTLRASHLRSASSSVHASMTESQSKLRLSFPDPLSSRERLDSGSAAQDVSPPPSSVEEHCEDVSTEDMPSCAEAPLVHSDSDTADEISPPILSAPDSATYALALFLYGSTASSKWQIAERIAKHILQLDEEAVSVIEDGFCRTYYFDCTSPNSNNRESNERSLVVRVVDRTSNFSEGSSNADNCPPSIAILLLPSSLPVVLPSHKFYLPLISPASLDFGSTAPVISSTFSKHVTTDSAYYTWRKLDLPKENVIVLNKQRPYAILDATALESIDAMSWARVSSVIFGTANEGQGSSRIHQGVKLFTNKWYTLAFFAATLAAVTVGGIQFRKGSTSAPAAANATSKATLVDTTPLDTASTLMTFVMSANHLALSTHSPPRSLATIIAQTTDRGMSKSLDRSPGSLKLIGVPSAATVSPVVSAEPSTQSNCHPRARSWIDKVNLSLGEYIPRDLIVRPVDLLGAASKGLLPVQKSSGQLTSLSLRTVQNSLTVMSSKSKVLKETAEKDMLVIHEAIDELLRGLGRQMNIAIEEMKDAKTIAQSGFSFRSARAKQNARRLRHAGEHFIKATGDHLRSRGEDVVKIANQVRESAKAIRREAVNLRQSRRSRRRKDKRRENGPSEVTNDHARKGRRAKRVGCATII